MTWHNIEEIDWHTIMEIEWHSIQEIEWHKMVEIRQFMAYGPVTMVILVLLKI